MFLFLFSFVWFFHVVVRVKQNLKMYYLSLNKSAHIPEEVSRVIQEVMKMFLPDTLVLAIKPNFNRPSCSPSSVTFL